MPKYNRDSTYTPFFHKNIFYKNIEAEIFKIFYKNIEAEIFKILRIFKNKRLRLKFLHTGNAQLHCLK